MNITERVMNEMGIERRPRSEWTDEQKIKFDRLVYGTGVGRLKPDGALEHVPFNELVFEFYRQPAERIVSDGALARATALAKNAPTSITYGEVFRGGEYQGIRLDPKPVAAYEEMRGVIPVLVAEIERLRAAILDAGLDADRVSVSTSENDHSK